MSTKEMTVKIDFADLHSYIDMLVESSTDMCGGMHPGIGPIKRDEYRRYGEVLKQLVPNDFDSMTMTLAVEQEVECGICRSSLITATGREKPDEDLGYNVVEVKCHRGHAWWR